ncbi:MAG: hypothetical protein HND52_20635 [Ignavibacteriae bacterium]|nr:hypothetical protein [Ignavibacteriota bacterium]NOH00379.1 hypothetical protein [Ignavibacteriota bacterium]
MNIKQICEEINRVAQNDSHEFADLQLIRQSIRGLKRIREDILFNPRDAKEDYAFHYGGRKELQFNFGLVGWKKRKGETQFRYGIAFSIERSQYFHNPEEVFLPRVKVFNNFLETNRSYFNSYKMYIHRETGDPEDITNVEKISLQDVKSNTFIFIGKFEEKSLEEIYNSNIETILNAFDYC